MAAPSYLASPVPGSFTDAGGPWDGNFWPVADWDTIPAGALLIVQVLQDGTSASTIAATLVSDFASSGGWIENLAGTVDSFTSIGSFTGSSMKQHLFVGRKTSATGADTSLWIEGTNSGTDDIYARPYFFTNVNTGTTLADVLEQNGTTTPATSSGSTAAVSDAGVITTGVDRLPLNFLGVSDDNAVAAFTGMTGGTWAEAVAEYASSTGTDGCVQLQLGYAAQSPNYTAGISAFQFGSVAGTNEKIAQSFVAGSTGTVNSYQVRLSKMSSPTDNVIIELCADAAGVPGTVLATNTVVGSSLISTVGSGGWISSSGGGATLTSGTTYWVVVRRSGAFDATNKYEVMGTTAGSQYTGTLYHYDSSWVAYAAANEADLQINMQFVNGTLDGGSYTMGSAVGWGVVGFALIGTSSPGPPPPHRRRSIRALQRR